MVINPLTILLEVFKVISDEMVSDISELTKDKIIGVLKKKKLDELLDVYDQRFLESHDTQISHENIDMQSVMNMRKILIHTSEKYLLQEYTDVKVNRRDQFLAEACQTVNGSSSSIKTYLGGFFDLVIMKETSDVSNPQKATLNLLADQIYGEITGFEKRVTALESSVQKMSQKSRQTVDFKPYYDFVKKRFLRKKEGEYKTLIGAYSDEEAYIDAYIMVDHNKVSILSYLEDWFCKNDYGSLLLYGEPGHGKSMLCHKAMVEYDNGHFLQNKAKEVLTISLNTGDNRRIIMDGMVNLENSLAWGNNRQHTFSFEDCRGTLLFMDGFDEFIDEARNTKNIKDIISFMKVIDGIADEYNIHIVVLSRTIAVQNELQKSEIKNKSFMILPITHKQQDEWLNQHNEYADYKQTFKILRNIEEMRGLLGIPFLFRLIVHSRFDRISTNVVELYDKLVAHLMNKRNIRGDDFDSVIIELMSLAYDIYCNNTDTASVPKDKWSNHWVFAFYIKQSDERVIGFFHRSFYQYFLARYIHSGVLNLTEEKAEYFIGEFAERELDATVRQYLSLMFAEKDKEVVNNNMKMVIDTLVRTEAYINLDCKHSLGDADKTKIGRTINVYRNTLHICAAASYVIQIPFKEGLSILLKTYPSNKITIFSDLDIRADISDSDLDMAKLIEADLSGAYFKGTSLKSAFLDRANLRGAYMEGVDLERADLRDADLRESILPEADLSGADLSGAKLCNADLSKANLHETVLRKANLQRAILKEADLRIRDLGYAIIDSKYRDVLDHSIEGYNTITWV